MTISQETPSTRRGESVPVHQQESRRSKPGRLIGRVGDPSLGPTLICIGAVHGNEPAGWLGLERVAAALQEQEVALRGEFVAMVGNREALSRGERWVDGDLNRLWLADRLESLVHDGPGTIHEEAEILELASEMESARRRATGDVWLLDLHTTSGEGPPFGVLDDTLPNREFAEVFDIPFVVGLEEELDGTLLSYFVSRGVRTFGLECGQHDDPRSADRAEAAIWLALVGTGLLERRHAPDLAACRRTLLEGTEDLPRTVEVRYRHAISGRDEFAMDPGWESFEPVTCGMRLASDRDGDVAAPQDGLLLMPLYQRQGSDGFFVVRPVRPVWMWMSALTRRLRAERFLHWLPGVRRAPGEIDGFLVNRRVARWFALEILHLLGFRRHGESGEHLLVSRRPNDGPRPH